MGAISKNYSYNFSNVDFVVDPDQKTAKLVTYFMIMNLVAAVLGFAAVILFGAFIGLMSFALLILVLPLGFEYFYLKRKTDNKES